MNIGMIGLGNLGTAVGNLIAANGHDVLGWEHDPAVAREIQEKHFNTRYLPGIPLHAGLRSTTDLAAVMQESRVVFIWKVWQFKVGNFSA